MSGIVYTIKAPELLAGVEPAIVESVRASLDELGDALLIGVRDRMKFDTGAERRNVRAVTVGRAGEMPVSLIVWGDLPQTQVDEEGRAAGAAFPPWRQGSALFSWVGRKGMVGASSLKTGGRILGTVRRTRERATGVLRNRTQSAISKQESIAFLVARAIQRRGIPANRPFANTFAENRSLIQTTVEAAIGRGVEAGNK